MAIFVGLRPKTSSNSTRVMEIEEKKNAKRLSCLSVDYDCHIHSASVHLIVALVLFIETNLCFLTCSEVVVTSGTHSLDCSQFSTYRTSES